MTSIRKAKKQMKKARPYWESQGACQNVGSQAEGLSFPKVQREFYFLAPRICDRRL